MYNKIDVYINKVYAFSTRQYPTCRAVVKEIRARKHIIVASIPAHYVTVYDYDTVKAVYAK